MEILKQNIFSYRIDNSHFVCQQHTANSNSCTDQRGCVTATPTCTDPRGCVKTTSTTSKPCTNPRGCVESLEIPTIIGCQTSQTDAGYQNKGKLNAACVFPFTVQGNTFYSCTYEFNFLTRNQKPWCSTKTDENGKHLDGNWGVCDMDTCNIPLRGGYEFHSFYYKSVKTTIVYFIKVYVLRQKQSFCIWRAP